MASATTFQFKAMDLAGATSGGEIEADSKAAVGEQLRQRGLIVLDVSEKSNPFKIEDLFKKLKGVDMRELSVFSRQFATLVASGMPMIRTLQTLEEQTQDEEIKEAIAGLRSDVRGRQLSGESDGALSRASSTASTERWFALASSRVGSTRCSTASPTKWRNRTRCAARSNRR